MTADHSAFPSLIAGYIGRFLALYLEENQLAAEVRLVDKVLPQLAWLAPEFSEACSAEKFMQADASRERKCPPESASIHTSVNSKAYPKSTS